jgi:flavin reductase
MTTAVSQSQDHQTGKAAAPTLRDDFIRAMGRAVTGVTIVGTGTPQERIAQTVSAMCSVTADPETLLVCVNRKSPLNEAITRNGYFSVSVLGRKHDHVADTFAGRPWPGKERWDFTCGDWSDAPSGAPIISDALANFDCQVQQVVESGTHFVYFGRVTAVGGEECEPLTYHSRSYGTHEVVPPSEFEDYPGSGPAHR